MRALIHPSELSGQIAAIPSKTYAHRILICAAIADGPTVIKNMYLSKDVEATINCLNALGVRTETDDNQCTVYPAPFLSEAKLDCYESDSTLRFLLPLVVASGVKAEFVGRGKLPSRPMAPLTEALRNNGAKIDGDYLPIKTKGTISGDKYSIDGSLSSQFVTGMMFALSFLGGKKKLVVTGEKVSASYIDVTIEVLRKFGVKVEKNADGYIIESDGLKSPKEITVDGDWSNAAFWIVAGNVGNHPVKISGLNYPSFQADSAIVDIMLAMGGKIAINDGILSAYPASLQGADIDVSDCPDLAPILSVAAAYAEGTTVFYGAERLKIKESDRKNAIVNNLQKCGISAKENNDEITIEGGKIKKCNLCGYNDHRIIMANAIALLQRGGEIDNIDAVDKSYPTFFSDLKTLGGKYDLTV